MDEKGLNQIFRTLGQIDEALRSHLEDAEKDGIIDLRGLDDARHGIEDVQKGVKYHLDVLAGETYPGAVTNPVNPPTVDGTSITTDVSQKRS